MPMAMTVLVFVFVPVFVSRTISGFAAARPPLQGAHGLPEHVQADAEDDEETRCAHARHFGQPDSETGAKHEIREPDDGDGGNDVDDCNLCRHGHAARDPDLASEKIRDDHQLAVSGPEGVNGAVRESKRKSEQESGQTAALTDRPHAVGNFGVQAALKLDDGADAAFGRMAEVGDEFDFSRRTAHRLRRRRGRSRQFHRQCDDCEHEQRNGADRAVAGGPAGNHGPNQAVQRCRQATRFQRHGRSAPRPGIRPLQMLHSITFFQTPQNALLWPRQRSGAGAGPVT